MKRKTVAGALIALLLGTTTLFAQPRGNMDRPGYGYGYGPGMCVNVLDNLTEEQKEKIKDLEISHQKAMVELRVERRSTVDPIEKNEIRGDMLKKVKAHRDEVRNLLTEEQVKQFDALMANNYYGRRGFNRGRRGGPGAVRGGWAGNGPGAGCPYYRGGRGYRGGW